MRYWPNAISGPGSTTLPSTFEAILYIAPSHCKWRQLLKDFPRYSTVQRYFYLLAQDGTLTRINHSLVVAHLERSDREPSPTDDVIDGQSEKTTGNGGPRGHDAGKNIKDGKRHIMADIAGRMFGVTVHTAGIQDCDGADSVITTVRRLYPWLRHLCVDGGFARDKLNDALADLGKWTLETDKLAKIISGCTGDFHYILLRLLTSVNPSRKTA